MYRNALYTHQISYREKGSKQRTNLLYFTTSFEHDLPEEVEQRLKDADKRTIKAFYVGPIVNGSCIDVGEYSDA